MGRPFKDLGDGEAWLSEAGCLRRWRTSLDQKSSKKIVLFMHGLESHGVWFAELAQALQSQGIESVTWDRPGFGLSLAKNSTGASYETTPGHLEDPAELLAQFKQLIKVLGDEGVVTDPRALHVCGLSWGGLGALYLATRAPESPRSLTLLAPGLSSSLRLSWRARLGIGAAIFSRPGNPALKQPVELPITPAMFTAKAEKQAFIAEDEWRTASVTRGFFRTTVALMKAIRQPPPRPLPPTLALLAETDQIINNVQVAKILGEYEIKPVILVGTRHSLIFEAPDQVARLMGDHLAKQ